MKCIAYQGYCHSLLQHLMEVLMIILVSLPTMQLFFSDHEVSSNHHLEALHWFLRKLIHISSQDFFGERNIIIMHILYFVNSTSFWNCEIILNFSLKTWLDLSITYIGGRNWGRCCNCWCLLIQKAHGSTSNLKIEQHYDFIGNW